MLNWMCRHFQIEDDKLPDEPVDAVVAIGIGVNWDGTWASPRSAGNTERAVALYFAGKARNVILTGGACHKTTKLCEAVAMKMLVGIRVPCRHLFVESRSRRTYQNADETLKIMKERGWTTAIIAAEALHARRVKATFKKRWKGNGMKIYVVAVKSPYGDSAGLFTSPLPFFLYDALMLPLSWVKGWI